MLEKDFLFLTGNSLATMRLTVEGAALMYTDEVMQIYSRAVKEENADDALALDLLGAALFSIKDQIIELQTAYMQMFLRQEQPQ